MAKCPKCDADLAEVKVEQVTLKTARAQLKGVAYCCPKCDAALSLELDPVALKADIVNEVVIAMKQPSGKKN